ncbi:MAG: hypothetical protein GX285_09315 [Clostridiales bacterium]|nr:hypothetical protein [Clostridiales bacterium]
MLLEDLIILLIVLFAASSLGYIAVIIKEKIYLSNNMVVIHNKYVSQDDLDKVDSKLFIMGNLQIMAGDEIKIYKKNLSTVKGLVIGANTRKKTIVVAANDNQLLEIGTNVIKKIKIISKYGKFLKSI